MAHNRLSPPSSGTASFWARLRGGIRIDLISTQSKRIVWRGGISSILKDNSPDPKRVERLNAMMAELFTHYPPKPANGR